MENDNNKDSQVFLRILGTTKGIKDAPTWIALTNVYKDSNQIKNASRCISISRAICPLNENITELYEEIFEIEE